MCHVLIALMVYVYVVCMFTLMAMYVLLVYMIIVYHYYCYRCFIIISSSSSSSSSIVSMCFLFGSWPESPRCGCGIVPMLYVYIVDVYVYGYVKFMSTLMLSYC